MSQREKYAKRSVQSIKLSVGLLNLNFHRDDSFATGNLGNGREERGRVIGNVNKKGNGKRFILGDSKQPEIEF